MKLRNGTEIKLRPLGPAAALEIKDYLEAGIPTAALVRLLKDGKVKDDDPTATLRERTWPRRSCRR